jgi:ELWxxDGT repeat protein
VLFQAYTDGQQDREIWVTDGTAAGTQLVADIGPGSYGSFPNLFTSLGDGRVLFQADNLTQGVELWVSDGTPEGTFMVKDIWGGEINNPGEGSGYPAGIVAIGDGRALFSAQDGENGGELWITDGTAEGTWMVADINPGAHSSPGEFTLLG